MKKTKILGTLTVAAVAALSVAAMPVSAADTYHAYIGVQTQNFAFRNAWNEPSYGLGVTSDDGMVYFDQITGWEGSTALNKGGDFTDVEITGDGTYKVAVTNFDFGADEYLNLLFVSTDIPLDCGASISDVKIIMDGNEKYTFDEAYLSPDETTYMNPMAINIWNDDLGKQDGLFGYMMPTSSIEIEFTVSGLGEAAAEDTAADDAAAEETPVSDSETTSSTTGNTSAAALAAVMGVAAAAAFVAKRK